MELFFEIVRMKQHFFLDSMDSESVIKLKQTLETIINVPPHKQRLYKKVHYFSTLIRTFFSASLGR